MISRFLKQVKLAKLLNSDKNSFIQNDFHCFYFNLSVPQDNEIKVKIMISIEFFIDVFIPFALRLLDDTNTESIFIMYLLISVRFNLIATKSKLQQNSEFNVSLFISHIGV